MTIKTPEECYFEALEECGYDAATEKQIAIKTAELYAIQFEKQNDALVRGLRNLAGLGNEDSEYRV